MSIEQEEIVTVEPRPAAGTQRFQGARTRRSAADRRLAFVGPAEVVALVLLGVAWFTVGGFSQYRLVLSLIVVYSIVCTGLVLLFGVGGQLSLGHAIFIGVGAMVAGNITTNTSFGLELELVLAAVIGFAIGVVVGLPSLRVSGLYLAIATFALSYAGQQILFAWKSVTGGSLGMRVGPLRAFGQTLTGRMSLLYCGLVVLGIALWLARNLMRGRTGRSLHAVRTSESAAAAVGAIRVGWLKVLAFALSAAFASAAGVLYMHTISFVNPETFSVDLSILLMLTVIIGGAHRLAGALLGAAFVLGLPELMRGMQEYEGMIYGGLLLLLILFAPGGIVSIFERATSLAVALVRGRDGSGEPVAAVVPIADDEQSAERAATAVSPEDDGDSALEVRDLEVTFGGLRAVDGVSFSVPPGSVIGLIGPNGAGKTTVFNAISGLVPSQGGVCVDGAHVERWSVRKRTLAGIGRTFQNLNLHPDRTVVDHLLIGMDRMLKYSLLSEAVRAPWVTKAERRVRDDALALLDAMGLAHVAESVVQDLPYGLQKRVDVARALATHPRLLLLDEPAAGLPTSEAEEMVDRVLQLTRDMGTTVVIIEHNVELVARVSERLIVMDAGRVLASGDPETTLRNPAVVAAYLGE